VPSANTKSPGPNAFHGDWRVFYTQQHGDNPTYEVTEQK
jgi:hypothetical protein